MHLSVKNLSKHYSPKGSTGFTLQPISFDVHSNQIVGIIGRSGSGKTTLLRCLNGLEKHDSGDITYNGHSLANASKESLRAIRRKIGFIAQGYTLLSHKTVYENVALPMQLHGLYDASNPEPILDALSCVGLHNLSGRYPSQLSGGQRQRVAIARALACEPHMLVCDEITSALDPETSLEILELLKRIHNERHVGMIVVTHDMNVVKTISTDVMVMDGGYCVEQGPTEDIIIAPQHPTTKALLASLWAQDLPAFIHEKLTPQPQTEGDDIVLQLSFLKGSSTQPFLANFILQQRLPLNILAGRLDHAGSITFGHLYVSMKHSRIAPRDMMAYFSNHGVDITVLGYIQWNT